MLSPLPTVPKKGIKGRVSAFENLRDFLGGVTKTPSLVVQSVKNLSTMQETQVRFLEDPVEKETAARPRILA